MAWPKSGNFVKYILPSTLILGAIPAYLIALILIYFIAFKWKLLPLGGGYGMATIPNASRFPLPGSDQTLALAGALLW